MALLSRLAERRKPATDRERVALVGIAAEHGDPPTDHTTAAYYPDRDEYVVEFLGASGNLFVHGDALRWYMERK